MASSITTTLVHKGIKWIDIVNPERQDVEDLVKEFHFHELDAEDCLTEIQRPKIDEYPEYLFIVLHFPVFGRTTKKISTGEVDIFIGQKFIITLHNDEFPDIGTIRDACENEEKKEQLLGRGTGYFLYELISTLFDASFPMVDKLWRKVNSLEKDVFDNEEVLDLIQDIMTMKRNIITFRRILQPQRSIVPALEYQNKKFLSPELEVYFDDIRDKVEKLWGSLESLKEVADTLQNANESFISHTTGNTIRVLTVFSVISVPFTLMNNIFSMNLWFPDVIKSSPAAFYIIVGLMFTLAASFVAFLRWKRWL